MLVTTVWVLVGVFIGKGGCAPQNITIEELAANLEDLDTNLPCQENELDHFRREYENCNKKAFAEIEINFDGEVRRPVNGNATCRAFDMLISECTKMLTFCFPDTQVEETVEKQKGILKNTVQLLLPEFDWAHCWSFGSLGPLEEPRASTAETAESRLETLLSSTTIVTIDPEEDTTSTPRPTPTEAATTTLATSSTPSATTANPIPLVVASTETSTSHNHNHQNHTGHAHHDDHGHHHNHDTTKGTSTAKETPSTPRTVIDVTEDIRTTVAAQPEPEPEPSQNEVAPKPEPSTKDGAKKSGSSSGFNFNTAFASTIAVIVALVV